MHLPSIKTPNDFSRSCTVPSRRTLLRWKLRVSAVTKTQTGHSVVSARWKRNIPRGLLAARATTGPGRIVQWSFNRPCSKQLRSAIPATTPARFATGVRSSSAQTSIARETLRQAFDRPCCWPPRVPQYATRFQRPTIDRKREIGKSLCRLKTVQAGQRATIDHGSRMPIPYIGDRLAMEPQKEFLKWKLIGFGRLAFKCRKKVCGDLMCE